MIFSRMRYSLLLAMCAAAVTGAWAADAPPQQSAHDLVKDVVWNELQDRGHATFWQYHVEKRVGERTVTEEQVETNDGPVFRVVANGGTPLNESERQQEEGRLQQLLRDPSRQARVKQQHEADEQRLERLMKLMPDAFLYDYDGMDGGLVRLKFRPDPAYKPPTYESRVFHGLAGTMWVSPDEKRLAHLSGTIVEEVDFGYGLLGKIEKGGTFELKRQQVSPTHWKTSLISLHMEGRLIFFKSVSKDQREVRSDFKPVPLETNLKEAMTLLEQAPGPS